MDKLNQLTAELEAEYNSFKVELNKFTEKNNKSASVRARKHALNMHNLTKDIRKQILEVKQK